MTQREGKTGKGGANDARACPHPALKTKITVVVESDRTAAVPSGCTVEAGVLAVGAVKPASIEAGRLIGTNQDVGTIAPDKSADLVAVPGDPLADTKLVQKPGSVMKSGVIYKQEVSIQMHSPFRTGITRD